MSLNHYVTLGKSGLKVSPLCLGTMTFGEDWGWGSAVSDCEKILARYIDLGGNFIDTANFYTFGHSEKIIGDFFRKDPFERQQMVIATKFFGALRPGDPNSGGAGRKSIIRACEESLRRLQTDYIDLYWMHAWDYQTPIEETMRAMDDLVSSGKVRYIGFSDTPAWKVAEAQVKALFNGWVPISAIQVEYSLLQRTVEGELIPMAQEFGMGVTPWSPLKSGVLSGKYRRDEREHVEAGRGEWVTSSLDDHAYDVVEKVIRLAEEIGSTPARVALNWVCSRPGVTSPIIGARTIQQLEDNLAALDVQLTTEHMRILNEVSEPALNFPAEFIKRTPAFRSSRTTINGETGPSNPLAPADGQEPY